MLPLLEALGAHEVGIMGAIEGVAVDADYLGLVGVLGFHLKGELVDSLKRDGYIQLL